MGQDRGTSFYIGCRRLVARKKASLKHFKALISRPIGRGEQTLAGTPHREREEGQPDYASRYRDSYRPRYSKWRLIRSSRGTHRRAKVQIPGRDSILRFKWRAVLDSA